MIGKVGFTDEIILPNVKTTEAIQYADEKK